MIGWDAVLVTALLLAAVYTDIKENRIPNWLTGSLLLFGIVLNLLRDGLPGAVLSLGGMAVAGGVFLIPYILGGFGAGDVKLMGAVGAWGGAAFAVNALLFVCVAGGVLSALVLLIRRPPKVLVQGIAEKWPALSWGADEDDGGKPKLVIPYGVAIAFGTWLTIFLGPVISL